MIFQTILKLSNTDEHCCLAEELLHSTDILSLSKYIYLSFSYIHLLSHSLYLPMTMCLSDFLIVPMALYLSEFFSVPTYDNVPIWLSLCIYGHVSVWVSLCTYLGMTMYLSDFLFVPMAMYISSPSLYDHLPLFLYFLFWLCICLSWLAYFLASTLTHAAHVPMF